MASYLVTGAAGFIGSVLAARLIKEGNKVVTIDNLSTGKESNVPAGCVFIRGNTYDTDVIAQLEKYSFDAVFHIAGQSSGEVSFENPEYDLKTNTLATLLLLDYCKKHGVKKFVYASSMATYGDHPEELVSETSEQIPKSFYAVGKLASENYMRIYSGFGIQCTALRFFNVFGIGQNLDNLKQGMASIYLAMAVNDRHIFVKGSKDRFRDFVYVDDVVQACINAVDVPRDEMFDVFNISNKRKITVEYINEMICRRIEGTTVEYGQGTPGDQFGIYGENQKAKEKLKWNPQIDFETGMNRFIDFVLSDANRH
ncbi:MAG: NAD-dependent epimerase/dehydratase family protein [Sphaerochaetaceae bacterium]|nr:NAD-dependent epimerase/dehydratase family protein [Sphaerochaetaceae bacterium]